MKASSRGNMKYVYLLGILILMVSCSDSKRIIDKPIIFDAERKQLTLDYLFDRYGLEQEEPRITPKMIVLHWTVIPTFAESFATFNPSRLPNRADIKKASALNVSSQFMVDRDGTIYRLLPETTMARHVIGLNHCAIGVENVGGTGDLPLTTAQLKANIWLVDYLSEKYEIEFLIGHYEYTRFDGHKLWLEKDAGYRTEKTDPGKGFMKTIREATTKWNFKSLPSKQIP